MYKRQPENLALVRLNYEAATLDASVTGLAGDVRADQIGAVSYTHLTLPTIYSV